MKRVFGLLALLLVIVTPALAVEYSFHGDLKSEFRINSNQSVFTASKEFAAKLNPKQSVISDDDVNDSFAALKYRLWTEAASDDGAIKGVFAVEIGGLHFGDEDGGDFSGDGKILEVRWAYTDFALADGRLRVGLQPVRINKFLWSETAAGIDYRVGDFEIAWYRGYEVVSDDNSFQDLDALFLRYNLNPTEGIKVGFFALWQTSDAANEFDSGVDEDGVAWQDTMDDQTWKVKKLTGFDLDLYTFGIDGGTKGDNFFANWDIMYQTGQFMEDMDFGGYLVHVDLGTKVGKGKITYTFWYASGDDDRNDDDLDAFIATDVDINSSYASIVLFAGLNSDQYFSADPYIQDKGLIMNRLGYDTKITDKLKVGVAALYMMTAEDLEYQDNSGTTDYADDAIGFELDAYASYKLYNSLEFALAAGYLLTDDALDFYEADHDGSADEDIYVITSRLRYKF